MTTFPYLNIYIAFSLFILLLEDTLGKIKVTAVEIDHDATDGQKFVKKIVHGDNISEKPGYLMFTAPYRLCEGGCKSDNNNFVMAFPLFVGAKGKAAYRNLYNRDHGKIHSGKPNAPFRGKTTREPVTPCPTVKINKNTPTILSHLIYKDTSESLEVNTPQTIVIDDTVEITTKSTTITPTTTLFKEKTSQSSSQPSITANVDIKRCPKIFPRICKKKQPKYEYSNITDDVEL